MVFLLPVRKLKAMFRDYLQIELKYHSSNAGKYIGTYFLSYSIYTYLYIIQWKKYC